MGGNFSSDGMRRRHRFFAPGRVNLIGDHTDYNGGLVFPAALSMGTYLTVTERFDHFSCGFSSDNEPKAFTLCGDALTERQQVWVDYPLGVLKEFSDRGWSVEGYDFHYSGDLPIGASLSSSASIEMVTAVALNALNGEPFTMLELVQMAQHAENDFVGMNCGIMDQFASGFGQKDCAIALDCNTLEYEHVPLEMQGLKFVIANTNKKRGLVDSAYNQRRSECQQALETLQPYLEADDLCQYSMEQFGQLSVHLSGDVLRRARHAVSEHTRVKEAIIALKNSDMARFGQLMNASHASLRDDYKVTCPELDFLVGKAQQFPGVLGSRMTGAGFGGCTVTLIAEDQVEAFIREVGDAYEQQFRIKADFYVAEIGNGAEER
ncbi:MAG: galactokinase [Bacteroidales bacterium]|nr:galactokinase [Bacteroidales bacterium]